MDRFEDDVSPEAKRDILNLMNVVGYSESTRSVAGIDRDVFETLAQKILRQELRKERVGLQRNVDPGNVKRLRRQDPLIELSQTGSRILAQLNMNRPLDSRLMEDYVRSWLRLSYILPQEHNANTSRSPLPDNGPAYNVRPGQPQVLSNAGFMINMILLLLKFVIGVYYFNACPAGKLVPVFLVVDAFRSIHPPTFIRPFLGEIQPSMVLYDIFVSLREKFYIFWNYFGIYIVCSTYQRMRNDVIDSTSPFYCNPTVFYFTVFAILFKSLIT